MTGVETDWEYRFAGFTLDPVRRVLVREDGEPVALTAKGFDALLYLLEHSGETVLRAAFTQALWPTVIVEDNNLSQTILAVRRALGEVEGGPRYIVTVPKQGYRFVADVEKRPREERSRTGREVDLQSRFDPRSRSSSPAATASAPIGAAWNSRFSRTAIAWTAIAVALLTVAFIASQSLGPGEDSTAGSGAIPAPGSDTARSTLTDDGRTVLPKSIAVLPFRNLSPDDRDAYFAAGMHEEILTQLAKIEDLKVIGRTSVMQYAEQTPHLSEIAATLRVSSVLEGSVRYAADHARIDVRLLDTASGTELWSEAYDAELRDVFKIQGDIALRIAAALQSKLGVATREHISAGPTPSPEAYAHYLRALAVYRTHGGIGVSLPRQARSTMTHHLHEALLIDPRFSSALGWKAHTDLDSLLFDSIPEDEWPARSEQILSQSERDARQALAYDATLGVAYTTLARIRMFRWQLDDARELLARARQANPNDTMVLHYNAMLYAMLAEYDSSIAAARRALEVDPLNPAPYSPLALSLRARGEPAAAAAAARSMIEVAPAAAIGYVVLARTQTQGDASALQEAREALRIAESFLEDALAFRIDAALSYARTGSRADAERLVRAFRDATKARHVDQGLEAMAHLALGEHTRAYERVQYAARHRHNAMDPFPLLLIRHNTWSDPVLEGQEWRTLREELAYKSPTRNVTPASAR